MIDEHLLRPAPPRVCACGWSGPASCYPCPACGYVWPDAVAWQEHWLVSVPVPWRNGRTDYVDLYLVAPADLAAFRAAHPGARPLWQVGARHLQPALQEEHL